MKMIEGLKKAAKFIQLQRDREMLWLEALQAGFIVIFLGIFYSAGHPISYLLVPVGVLAILNGLRFKTSLAQLGSVLTLHIAFLFISGGVMILSFFSTFLPVASPDAEEPVVLLLLSVFAIGFAIARLVGYNKIMDKDVTPDENSLERLTLLIDHMKTAKPGADPEMIKMEIYKGARSHVHAKPVENHVMAWAADNEVLEFVPINRFSLELYFGFEREGIRMGDIKGAHRVFITMHVDEKKYLGFLNQEDIDRFNHLLQSLGE